MRVLKRPLTFISGFVVGGLIAAVPVAWAVSDARPGRFDATSPTLSVRPLQFVLGASIDAAAEVDPNGGCNGEWNNSIPMRLRWKATDATSGVDHVEVWTQYAGFEPQQEASYDGTSTTSHAYTASSYDGTCGGGTSVVMARWLRVEDVRGNTAASALLSAPVQVWDENAEPQAFIGGLGTLSVARTGLWQVADCDCFNHGHTAYTSTAGASSTYTVTTTRPGQTIALVMEKNTNRGVVRIRVDHGKVKLVDTYAATPTHRVIVWQKTLGKGTHTITLVNAGTPGRSRIDVDSLLLSGATAGVAPVVG